MTRAISDIIEGIVRKQFADTPILAVRVSQDTDYDGDAVFRVTVIVDDGAAPLDAHKTSGIARHIRHKLLAKREDTFPILAFISKSDAKRMETEAA
jgi:hypothetical protein